MIRDLISKTTSEERNAIARAANGLMDIGNADLDLENKLRGAVAALANSGLSLDTFRSLWDTTRERTGDISGALVEQTGRYVIDPIRSNPRRAGIGAGTVAVAAVGAYALYRLYEAKAEREAREEAEAMADSIADTASDTTLDGAEAA